MKVAGRYLGPFLAHRLGHDPSGDELADLSASGDEAGEQEENRQALLLVLFAAEADAAVVTSRVRSDGSRSRSNSIS